VTVGFENLIEHAILELSQKLGDLIDNKCCQLRMLTVANDVVSPLSTELMMLWMILCRVFRAVVI
jgi:hypothetical protein